MQDEIQEDSTSMEEKLEALEEVCPFGLCDGSGELPCDEDDGEGHVMRGVGTQMCVCKIKEKEYEPEE